MHTFGANKHLVKCSLFSTWSQCLLAKVGSPQHAIGSLPRGHDHFCMIIDVLQVYFHVSFHLYFTILSDEFHVHLDHMDSMNCGSWNKFWYFPYHKLLLMVIKMPSNHAVVDAFFMTSINIILLILI